MPEFEPSDIPELSDQELEEFLNTTIAELVPGSLRIQGILYNRGICIVADLLRTDQTKLGMGQRTRQAIGQRIQEIIQILLCKRDESLQTK